MRSVEESRVTRSSPDTEMRRLPSGLVNERGFTRLVEVANAHAFVGENQAESDTGIPSTVATQIERVGVEI